MQVSYKSIENLVKLLVIIGAIILVVFILINKSNHNSNTNSSSGSSNPTSSVASTANPYAVLPPATVAPKLAECNQTIGYNGAGVPSPLQCSNGNLNTAAWNALSAQEPKVMALGYSPSSAAIQSAVCSDINAAASDSTAGADNSIETGTFQISALYYGWNFGSSAGSYISKC